MEHTDIKGVYDFLVYKKIKEENNKSHNLTRIPITTAKNTGDLSYKGGKYSGKCLFISLAQAISHRFSRHKQGLGPMSMCDFIYSLMSEANFTGYTDVPELIVFDGNEIIRKDYYRIEHMCKKNHILSRYRIEIYSGIIDDKLYAEPEPNFVFNQHITDDKYVIRIVSTQIYWQADCSTDHFEYILNPDSDFFHPVLLNMSREEINHLSKTIKQIQNGIVDAERTRSEYISNQIKSDAQLALQFQQFEEAEYKSELYIKNR